MPRILKLDEIKRLIDIPQLIREIETGFVLYSEHKVVVPPVGFLHFDQPPGDVHIKYGFVTGDDFCRSATGCFWSLVKRPGNSN